MMPWVSCGAYIKGLCPPPLDDQRKASMDSLTIYYLHYEPTT